MPKSVGRTNVQVPAGWPQPEPSLPVTTAALRKFEFKSFTTPPVSILGRVTSGGRSLEIELRPLAKPQIKVRYAGKDADGTRMFRAVTRDEAKALLAPLKQARANSTWDLQNQELDKMIGVLSKLVGADASSKGWAPKAG